MDKTHKSLTFIILALHLTTFLGAQSISTSTQIFDEKLKLSKGSVIFEDTSEFILNNDLKTIITHSNGDTLFIAFYGQNFDNPSVDSSTLISINAKKNQKYILTSLNYNNKFEYTDWDIRPLTVPIKIRPKLDDQPMQFVGDVSIGPYLAYQIGSRRYGSNTINDLSLSFAIFSTPTYVKMDASNNTAVENTNNANTVLGITLGGGILFDINTIQFGLVSGFDWVGGDNSETWIYQGKTWVSFSLAFQIPAK